MTIRLAIKARATERHTKTEIVQIPAKTNYVVIIGVFGGIRVGGMPLPGSQINAFEMFN